MEHRRMIFRNLFAINPCLAQILELWHVNFASKTFVNITTLTQHDGAFDLSDFTVRLK